MLAPQPNIGDFLVCYNPLEECDLFRCIVINETPDRYDTIVLLHDEDDGFPPGAKFSMEKPVWKSLFRAPVDIRGTHWRIEEVKSAT